MRSALLSALLSVVVAAACVGVLWTRFNAPPPDHGRLYPHDLIYSYYPKLDLVGARLASGELPLWNPHGCAGVPLLAGIQHAVLYPPTLLAAFVPAADAIAYLSLFHLLLAGTGAALLFRYWGAGALPAGALGGVFVFACGLGQTPWPPQVAAIAWLPWMLLCIEHALARNPTRPLSWCVALTGVVALQILSGFPQYVIYSLHLAVPLALLRAAGRAWARPEERPRAATALARVALAMLLGVGIAGAQLLPAVELIAESERRESLSPEEVQYLQPKARLGTLLANSVDPKPRNPAFEVGSGAGYLGTATLVFAAVGLACGRRRPLAWLLLGLGGGALLLSEGYVGSASAVFEIYASLPVLGSLRSPERLLLVAGFAWVGLAALGAASLREPSRREARIATAATAGACLAIAVAGSTVALLWAAAAATIVLSACWLPRRGWLAPTWQTAAALLLIVDVASVTGRFGSLRHVPTAWAEVMHVDGRTIVDAETFAAQRERVGHGRVQIGGRGMLVRPFLGTGPIRGGYRLACYETPVPEAWQKVGRLVPSGDYESVTASYVDPERFGPLLDMAGVVESTQVKTIDGRNPSGSVAGRIYARRNAPAPHPPPGTTVTTTRNEDALPRAYLVGDYVVEAGDSGLLRAVRGGFDHHNSVLLDREPELSGAERIDSLLPATIEDYRPERVEIATRAPAEALLVLSDTHYPGWHATLDGKPASILRANGLFRAVVVPKGEHRVVFAYTPSSFRNGAWLSAGSLALWIAVMAFALRRRR
jgi:hypothetical protein